MYAFLSVKKLSQHGIITWKLRMKFPLIVAWTLPLPTYISSLERLTPSTYIHINIMINTYKFICQVINRSHTVKPLSDQLEQK